MKELEEEKEMRLSDVEGLNVWLLKCFKLLCMIEDGQEELKFERDEKEESSIEVRFFVFQGI